MKRKKPRNSKRPYRRKHDPDELVTSWKQSGLSKTEFCRQRNIGSSILYRAINDGYGQNGSKPSPFIKAVVERSINTNTGGAVIEFPNGITIRVDDLTAGLFDLIRKL